MDSLWDLHRLEISIAVVIQSLDRSYRDGEFRLPASRDVSDQKKGLCAFSSPTVVDGPCPGKSLTSSGSDSR